MTLSHDTMEMSADIGGEIGDMIDLLSGHDLECICGHESEIGKEFFFGYPHDGGLSDKDGQKWWVYTMCPECEYQWSLTSIESRLKRQEVIQ